MTMFAYYHETKQGSILQSVLDDNKYILLDLAEFSYAETPLEYDIILGVTGTLETLSDQQKRIIEDKFKILYNTYYPTVHLAGGLQYNEKSDILIIEKKEFNSKIVNEITIQKKLERSIIVFFENNDELNKFM